MVGAEAGSTDFLLLSNALKLGSPRLRRGVGATMKKMKEKNPSR
jgi:hypothetical protein